MKITVFCRPSSAKPGIEKLSETEYRVKVRAAAEKGEANTEVLEIVAEYFEVDRVQVELLTGQKSRRKIVAIKTKRGQV